MVTTLAAIALLAQQVSLASDFYPLRPGDEFTYLEESMRVQTTFVDRVGEPIDLKGRQGYPITTYLAGQPVGTGYFAVQGDTVLNLALDKDKPLETPYPILVVGDKGAKWEHTGAVPVAEYVAMVTMKGESKRGKPRQLFGETRQTLEVSFSMDTGDRISSRQKAVYASGLGLVEMEETTQLGRQRMKRTRKLIAFKPAPPPTGGGQ